MDKQDQVNKGGFSLGIPTTFFKAHPDIESIEVSGEIYTTDHKSGYFNYDTTNPPGDYIRCINSDCTDGGWCVADVIREMKSQQTTEEEFSGRCSGHHKSRNKQHFPKLCLTTFKGKITIKYKEKEA